MKQTLIPFKTSIWKLYLFTVLAALISFASITVFKWHDIYQEASDELIYLHKLVSNSAQDRFEQHAAMLQLLGQRLMELDAFEHPQQAQALLDDFLITNPVFSAYGLASPDGELILTSHNLSGKPLPNLLQAPSSAESFRYALQSHDVTLGRTYFFQPLNQWIMPLRYAIRNADGDVFAVLATGISIKGAFNPWNIQSKHDVFINAIKDIDSTGNYFWQYLNTYSDNPEVLYNTPIPKASIEEMLAYYSHLGIDLHTITRSDLIRSFTLNLPLGVMEGERLVTLSYNPDLRLITVIGRYTSSIKEAFWHIEAAYIGIFILFNLIVFALFWKIDRQQFSSKEQLRYLADHDPLTHLPNRYFLTREFPLWQQRQSEGFGVLYFDLDNFKYINDHYGHTVGDDVLQEVAVRLQRCCTQDEILIRHGGDEFIILTPYCDKARVIHFVEHCNYQLSESIRIGNLSFTINSSTGIALAATNDYTFDELLSQADLAMYEAKKERNSYAFFTEHLKLNSAQQAQIAKELHQAIENDELSLHYQPQIDAESGKCIGIEALLRWNNATLGQVPPDRFIPVAENSGQINAIGAFVIETAFSDLVSLLDIIPDMRLSINVSVRQLLNEQFRPLIKSVLQTYRLPAEKISLEVTESLFIEDLKQIQKLLQLLRNDGFKVSLDDFGTGYSSLSVLSKLPINEVKIDKSFVRDILVDDHDRALIHSIISIGKALDIPTLAEGVETIEQARILKSYGCNLFQGYYFSKPRTFKDLLLFIETYGPADVASN